MVDARGGVRPGILPVTLLDEGIVVGDVGDEDAGTGAIDALPRVAGALEGLVDDLEKLSLRCIDRLCLEAGDAEEAGVEKPWIIADIAALDCRRAGPAT